MATHKSYILFDYILKHFWASADEQEKLTYFPVWFWWEISGILPLRPTCIVLTPRLCIRECNGKYYLAIRRTKLKKKVGSKYNLDDYEICEYRITEAQYNEIKRYIAATDSMYESDLDTLFCKATQFSMLAGNHPNDKNYTYANLNQALNHFYEKVIQKRYGYTIVNNVDDIRAGEIEKISLGDTRVFSMISLFITGNSAIVCKELAGHDTIEMSEHYYSNIVSFLDTMSFSLFRGEDMSFYRMNRGIIPSGAVKIDGGYCISDAVKSGDFSACTSAVDKQGHVGSHYVCPYFLPDANLTNSMVKQSEQDMGKLFSLMRDEIKAIRHAEGATETLEALLSRFKAEAYQYVQHSIQRQYYLENQK